MLKWHIKCFLNKVEITETDDPNVNLYDCYIIQSESCVSMLSNTEDINEKETGNTEWWQTLVEPVAHPTSQLWGDLWKRSISAETIIYNKCIIQQR